MTCRLCFSLSSMGNAERARLEGLQKRLGLSDLWGAVAIEPAIVQVLEQKVEMPYDGWFGAMTLEQRKEICDYIEQNKHTLTRAYYLEI